MPIVSSMVEGCAQSPRYRLAYGIWPIAYGSNYMPSAISHMRITRASLLRSFWAACNRVFRQPA